MRKSRPPKAPYIRTSQMARTLEPSWAKSENAALASLVSRMEPLRLPELTARLNFAHVAAADAGHSVGLHLDAQIEIFRVESGCATFYINEKPFVFRRGQIGIMPARTVHRWQSGGEPAVFLGLTV